MSKVIKSVKKTVSKVFKEVKRFVKSDLGKAVLIGAAVFVGGGALGMWKTPFESVNGALAGGGSTSAAGSGAQAVTQTAARLPPAGLPTVTTTASPAAAAGVAETAAAGAGTAGVMDAAYKAPTMAESVSQGAADQVGQAVRQNVAAAGTQEGKKGIISRMMDGTGQTLKTVGAYAKDNPMASAMMLSAAGSAASPDEIDIMRERQQLDQRASDEERVRREENLAGVGNIDIGAPRQVRPLRFLSTQEPILQRGMINNQMGGPA